MHGSQQPKKFVSICGRTSVQQNPATDNPFVAKNQNLYFRGSRCIWFDF